MLLGSIKPGTIAKLFKALTGAKADGILLLDSGGQRAQIVFRDGNFSKASAAGLTGEDALVAVKRWSDGHYALKKKTEDQPLISKGHVFIAVDEKAKQKQLAGWLNSLSFESSVIPYVGELDELVNFLRPEVVITDCPLKTMGVLCHDLVARLSHDEEAPVVVAIPEESSDCKCDLSRELWLKPFSKGRLQEILRKHLEPTASGVAFQQLVQEELVGDGEVDIDAMEQTVVEKAPEAAPLAMAPTDPLAATVDEEGEPEAESADVRSSAPRPDLTDRVSVAHGGATTAPSNRSMLAPMAVLAIGSIVLWALYLLLRG